jgi:CRP-like cAMP-binding protein
MSAFRPTREDRDKEEEMERNIISTDSYSPELDIQSFGSNTTEKGRKSATASLPVTNSSNTLLRSLPAPLFEALRPSLRSVFLPKDRFLYLQDDRLDYVYFPETAVVSELRTLDDGRMVEVAITGREGAAGLSALFCSSRVANCTQVSQAGSAIKVDRAELARLTRVYPEMRRSFAPYMDQYIRQISQRAICNMFHSVRERFCTWLLLVQDRCGRKTLKITHEQIARTLGVYRPSVTCIALEMRKDKLIDYSRGGINIRDRERMESGACGCYDELAIVN